jgi:hypothetical protein
MRTWRDTSRFANSSDSSRASSSSTNHTNFNNPVSTLSSAAFGKIQSAGDPRIQQFAAKFYF